MTRPFQNASAPPKMKIVMLKRPEILSPLAPRLEPGVEEVGSYACG